jgi:hypothetical protein
VLHCPQRDNETGLPVVRKFGTSTPRYVDDQGVEGFRAEARKLQERISGSILVTAGSPKIANGVLSGSPTVERAFNL